MADSSGSGGLSGAVIAAVAGAAATAVLGWLTPFWGWLTAANASLWTHLGAKSGWPNWMLYLLALISLHRITSSAIRWSRNRKDSHTRFDQLHFQGALWRWEYISGHPAHLTSFCPTCDTRLVYEELGSVYDALDRSRVLLHCEHCSQVRVAHDGTLKYLQARVGREIDRVIRTDEWRQHVAPKEGAARR